MPGTAEMTTHLGASIPRLGRFDRAVERQENVGMRAPGQPPLTAGTMAISAPSASGVSSPPL